MKTCRFFIVVTIFACFFAGKANAQPDKVTFDETWTVSWYIPCIEETLSGDIQISYTYWDNWRRWQFKSNGTVVGEVSGDVYTVKEVANDNALLFNDHASVWTMVSIFSLKKDGSPVILVHSLQHHTWSLPVAIRTGEPSSLVDNYSVDCH
jgi:hypothetical protein